MTTYKIHYKFTDNTTITNKYFNNLVYHEDTNKYIFCSLLPLRKIKLTNNDLKKYNLDEDQKYLNYNFMDLKDFEIIFIDGIPVAYCREFDLILNLNIYNKFNKQGQKILNKIFEIALKIFIKNELKQKNLLSILETEIDKDLNLIAKNYNYEKKAAAKNYNYEKKAAAKNYNYEKKIIKNVFEYKQRNLFKFKKEINTKFKIILSDSRILKITEYNHHLSIWTKNILITIHKQIYNLGQYLICINYDNFNNINIRVFNTKYTNNKLIWNGMSQHPHINSNGIICWGNLSTIEENLIKELKIIDVLLLTLNMISSYNDQNAYINIISFCEFLKEIK